MNYASPNNKLFRPMEHHLGLLKTLLEFLLKCVSVSMSKLDVMFNCPIGSEVYCKGHSCSP